MKNVQKSFAKIKVLKCEEKLSRDTKRQDFDRDGNPLWTVSVLEMVQNEEFNVMEQAIVKYKTLEKMTPGDHIVEFKSTSMGEGSGSFVKVNTFYTILRTVSAKTSMEDLFGSEIVTPAMKRNIKSDNKQATVQ